MPLHLRELPKGQRFVLTRTGDKFAYLDHSCHHLCARNPGIHAGEDVKVCP